MDLRRAIAPLMLAASTGLIACGGGGDGGSSALSRQDIAKRANALCDKAGAKINAVKPPANIQDATAAAAYFDQISPVTHRLTQDLAALSPADDVKVDWNAFMARQREADALLQTIRRKANARDRSGLQDLQRFAGTVSKASSAARKAGATHCS